jgi:hypothetical protein
MPRMRAALDRAVRLGGPVAMLPMRIDDMTKIA